MALRWGRRNNANTMFFTRIAFMKPSADQIRELLSYNPETGVFLWKSGTLRPNSIAGTTIDKDGRRAITVLGERYRSAVLAFLLMTGRWPELEIDHADCDPSNDAWQNLRQATRIQQLVNRRCMGNSTSRLKGIYKNKNGTTWNARIRVDGKRIYIGNFPTAEAAHLAYCEAARRQYGEFARVA